MTCTPVRAIENDEYTITVYRTPATRFGILYWADNDIAPRENPHRTAYSTIEEAAKAEQRHIESKVAFHMELGEEIIHSF